MKNVPKILYVDDDLSSLILLKEQLRNENIEIVTASNGKTGLALYQEFKDELKLVILDIHMPSINGYDMLLGIRKENPDVPIIMITATSFIENKDTILKLGADEYVIKPVPQHDMLKLIKKYLY